MANTQQDQLHDGIRELTVNELEIVAGGDTDQIDPEDGIVRFQFPWPSPRPSTDGSPRPGGGTANPHPHG